MPDQPQMSLTQLLQLYQQQQQLGMIPPQGRYMGGQYMPNSMDQMALPNTGLPPDKNASTPDDLMGYRAKPWTWGEKL